MPRQQSSTLSIDQSSLSVLHNESPKSAHQLQSQHLFKQCSEYRTQIRQLKQDNEWLHSVNYGLTNECNVLKEMLNEKKSTIVEINSELRIAEEEINRLEDLLAERDRKIEGMEEIGSSRVGRLEQEIDDTKKTISQLERELDSKNREIQKLCKEKSTVKQQFQSKQRIYIQQMQQKVTKVLERVDRPDKFAQQSSSQPTNQPILNQMITKIESLASMLQKQRYSHTTQIKSAQKLVEMNQKQIQTLQYQLKQATQLVEQYQQQNIQYSAKIKQMEVKIENLNKIGNKNMEIMVNLHRGHIDKLIELLNPLLKGEESTMERLGLLMKGNRNQYEIDVMIQQLKPIITSYSISHTERTHIKRSLKQKQNQITLLEQQYDSLKLKHLALQRQYQAIIEDNRRILKFNQISRYRTERNVRNESSCYTSKDKNKDKENIDYSNKRR